MKARCPKSPKHKHFITVAHVMQEWVVDENGEFCKYRKDLEVSFKPDPGNIWTCATCGAKAIVE